MTLKNLRVLFLPHAARADVLLRVMQYGRDSLGWRVGIMGPSMGPGVNAGLLDDPGDLFSVPNWGRPAPWESDVARKVRIRALVRDCEAMTGLPVNRIVLAGERVIGRGYGREHYHWPSTVMTRRVLLDNTEPERAVERLFAFAAEMLDRFQPDLVISGHLASPETMVIFLMCRLRGIPFLANRSSKILSNRGFWTGDRLMLNTAASERCRSKIDGGVQPGRAACDFLAEFRGRPRTVAYIQRNWDRTTTRLRVYFTLSIQALSNFRYYLRGQREIEPKPVLSRLVERYRIALLTRLQRGYFRSPDEAELRATPYIYVALHKEPELAINVQHPEWHSQKNLIAWLSANLPAGFHLLVRDHRFNKGRRPTRFLSDVLGYPGVVLLDSAGSQFKYIKNAALIVTDNGTTGWEGLIFGRRVLLLGENYYSATGLARVADRPGRLGEEIIALLNSAPAFDELERDRRLCCLIEAEFETTTSDDDIEGAMKALESCFAGQRVPTARASR